MQKSQEIVDRKLSATPNEQLEEYVQRGKFLPVQQLTRQEISRLYYGWLKNDKDNRTFDAVFNQRIEDHLNYWRKCLGIALLDFKPEIIGTWQLARDVDYEVLTITSKHYQKLTIKRPAFKSNGEFKNWLTIKCKSYEHEHVVTINVDELLVTNSTNMMTAVLL